VKREAGSKVFVFDVAAASFRSPDFLRSVIATEVNSTSIARMTVVVLPGLKQLKGLLESTDAHVVERSFTGRAEKADPDDRLSG